MFYTDRVHAFVWKLCNRQQVWIDSPTSLHKSTISTFPWRIFLFFDLPLALQVRRGWKAFISSVFPQWLDDLDVNRVVEFIDGLIAWSRNGWTFPECSSKRRNASSALFPMQQSSHLLCFCLFLPSRKFKRKFKISFFPMSPGFNSASHYNSQGKVSFLLSYFVVRISNRCANDEDKFRQTEALYNNFRYSLTRRDVSLQRVPVNSRTVQKCKFADPFAKTAESLRNHLGRKLAMTKIRKCCTHWLKFSVNIRLEPGSSFTKLFFPTGYKRKYQ